ncbi:MAG TPA: DUF4397 domain-containing protein [Burkholderiaceae bacterium]
MKKREFLAVGGAMPLMLAGCGGSGSGSAPVRLVNASVGYPSLGFMVETTQATSSDVAYGSASPFETVQAGSVTMTLTVGGSSVVSTNRNLGKDTRYTLVAYGFKDELKSLLVTESTVAPDSGRANINVLNTSVDIGSVDVYMQTTNTTDLSLATQIASSVTPQTQSPFYSALPGTYYITVVGAGSLANGKTDVRFRSTGTITIADQDIVTVILTPGASGTLANAIVLFQQNGPDGSKGATSFLNTQARLRVVTAVPNGTVVAVGPLPNSTTNQYLLPASNKSQVSGYADVATGTPPPITYNGSALTVTGAITQLAAGGDYTLAIYPNGGTPTATLFLDDNTAPLGSAGVKYRLMNLAYDNPTSALRMTVNSKAVANNVVFPSASTYTEVATPQTIATVATVSDGAQAIYTIPQQVLVSGNVFTEVIVSYTVAGDGTPVVSQFTLSADETLTIV